MHVQRLLLAVIVTGFLLCGTAFGHVMLESSVPANHAVLNTAPKSIELTFSHPTKLVMLKLHKGKDVIPVTVETSGATAKSFLIALPALTPGNYEAMWSTLSPDGHPMKGVISFTISAK
jgi:methionine-rich copper-binding protein CopC